MEYREFMDAAASVVPSPRQAAHLDTEFFAFVHFTVNTYTDLEWGLGNEPESVFNPVELDCDQWVEAIKSAGMTGMVLTALFLKEYPTRRQVLFCIMPVAGVIIISATGKDLGVSNLLLGSIFLLLTMLSSAPAARISSVRWVTSSS